MDSTDNYLDRIEELTYKFNQAEKKLQAFEDEKKQLENKVILLMV